MEAVDRPKVLLGLAPGVGGLVAFLCCLRMVTSPNGVDESGEQIYEIVKGVRRHIANLQHGPASRAERQE
jgi:hypothetical protein